MSHGHDDLTAINSRIERLASWILEEERNQGGHGRIIAGKKCSMPAMISKDLSRSILRTGIKLRPRDHLTIRERFGVLDVALDIETKPRGLT